MARGRWLSVLAAAVWCAAHAAGDVRAQVLCDSTSVAGDSISRGFDANTGSCNYGDNVSRNWASGDDHGGSFCASGGDGTFSQAERLECAKGANISIFNNAASGAKMVSDFYNQATGIRNNLSPAPAPRLINVLLGHNDACTSTTSKTGNGCGGDRDPNNYCRTTNAAFEREFRRGMDQLIQIPSSRVSIYAVIRVSQLCNFSEKNGCGLSFGLNCSVIWSVGDVVGDLFGGGICASLTTNCSNQRRIDMYNTLVGYNEILQRVTNEYIALAPGAASATGAIKANDVQIRYLDGTFYYKFTSSDVSCCDCFHPSDQGQRQLSEFAWNGLRCSTGTQCCADTSDPLANATCTAIDTWSDYQGGFWQDGLVCGNGIIDPGEQCDDANTADGDCCSSTCEPADAGLSCADDGNACTADLCDGAGQCDHLPLDGIPCDDGLFCNGSETCGGGVCGSSTGDPCSAGGVCNDQCNEETDDCADPAGTACTDDGNGCTTDVCDGGGNCAHLANDLPCDDGLFCNGVDFCGGGTCSLHFGDPCLSGVDCNNLCNEAADNCFDPPGNPCADDGNFCSDDFCNGTGVCLHPNNSRPCDDFNACTVGDHCSSGSCSGGSPVECENCQTCDPFSGCGGPICTATPSITPTPTSTPTPTNTPTPSFTRTGTATATATPVPTFTHTATATPVDPCPPAPLAGCRTAERSLLLLKTSDDGRRDRVLWKFIRGASTTQAEFGLPKSTSTYELCVYDGNGRVLTLLIEPSGAHWTALSGRGYRYRDPARSQDGVDKMLLKGSDRDRSRLLLKAKGEGVPTMDLGDLPTPLIVQLSNSDTPVCWTSTFDAADVSRNQPDYLKAVDK